MAASWGSRWATLALGTDFREIAVRGSVWRRRSTNASSRGRPGVRALPGPGLADAVMDEPAVGVHCRVRYRRMSTAAIRDAATPDRVHHRWSLGSCSRANPRVPRPWRTNRDQHHIPGQLFQIGVPLHDDRLEPSLEHMTTAPVQILEALRIDAVQLAHAFRYIPSGVSINRW